MSRNDRNFGFHFCLTFWMTKITKTEKTFSIMSIIKWILTCPKLSLNVVIFTERRKVRSSIENEIQYRRNTEQFLQLHDFICTIFKLVAQEIITSQIVEYHINLVFRHLRANVLRLFLLHENTKGH